MRRAGLGFCWLMAVTYYVGCALESLGVLPSGGQHDLHAVAAAIWIVGALILTELSNRRAA